MSLAQTDRWKAVRLGELVEVKHGFAFLGEFFRDEPTEHLVVTPGNFAVGGGFQIREGREKFYKGPIDPDYVLRPDDLIVTMTDLSKESDTLGFPARVPYVHGITCLHNQRIGRIVFRESGAREIDSRFLYYLLCSDEYRAEVMASATGTGVKHTAPRRIEAFTCRLPEISYQRAVAGVLGALDDKIEVNGKTNRALEALASALFKSWFVDFDPVIAKRGGKTPVGVPADAVDLFPSHFEDSTLGPIPKGWHIARLGDLAELNARTLSPKDVPSEIRYVEISNVHRGDVDNITVYARGSEPSRARRIVRDGDTVVSAVRPERGAYFLCLKPPPNLIVSTGFVVLTPHADQWALVYCAATSDDALDHYELHAEGGAYPAMRPEAVNDLRLAMPPRDAIRECFSSIVKPLLKYADANRNEARRLAELRDALLPPLLSGEITLKTAEKTVAEVV